MKVRPLAADSLGVRSMATFVEVAGAGLLIDPGATLAASRYNLPPAEEEWEALRRANDRISAYAARADTVFVSHYHDDHFRTDPGAYAGRTVLAKDPRRMIQGQQARRAGELWKTLEPVARLSSADGFRQRRADFSLEVSPALGHGSEGTPFGYVVALTVVDHAERERFVFASDLQGPVSPVAAAYLIQQKPTLLYLSGPPTYIERELGTATVDRGIANLVRVIEATGCRVILDHHAMRDTRSEERLAALWETGQVQTAAGFLGVPEAKLEAGRAALWARVRKPAGKAGVAARATMTRDPRTSTRGTFARGGTPE